MKHFLFEECGREERIEMMSKVAMGKERITYMRNLTEAEIDAESKELASLCRRRNSLEEDKKAINKEYQAQIDVVKQGIDKSAALLEDGRKECVEECFKVLDIDAREVGYYNMNGELVRERKALDDDFQLDMFNQPEQALEAANRLSLGTNADNLEDAEVVEYEEEGQDGYLEKFEND